MFSHILRIIIPTDFHIFQSGWNHQSKVRFVWKHGTCLFPLWSISCPCEHRRVYTTCSYTAMYRPCFVGCWLATGLLHKIETLFYPAELNISYPDANHGAGIWIPTFAQHNSASFVGIRIPMVRIWECLILHWECPLVDQFDTSLRMPSGKCLQKTNWTESTILFISFHIYLCIWWILMNYMTFTWVLWYIYI